MRKIEIPRHEQGVVRVFSISRPMAQMAGTLNERSKADVAGEMLGTTVDPADIELFALSDLAGMGLVPYLTEGHGIEADALKADRARLDALDGFVLIYRTTKPLDDTRVLEPGADLTLIGTYAEPRSSRAAAPIRSEAAAPFSGAKPPEQTARKSPAGSFVVAVIAVLILVFIWWIAT